MGLLWKLFDTSGFPRRWDCGQAWRAEPWLGHLHIVSDLSIWAAYLAIPCVLGYFVLRRKDLPFRSIFLLFGAFIVACGTTHLMEALIFGWPAYRLAGLVKLVTAVVSWATVLALVPVVPRVLALRSPEELEREIAARKHAEEALQSANAALEQRVAERTAEWVGANALLREERERFRTTLASIGDAVIVTDDRGRITFLNAVASSLTGWGEDALGRDLPEVMHIVNQQTRRPVENPVQKVLERGTIVGLANHTVLLARGGGERPIDDSAAPIRDAAGQLTGVVLVFRDVSERRLADEALRQSERRWRGLAEALPNLVWSTLPDGQCDYLSSQWGVYTGIPENELLGLRWPGVLHPDDRQRTLDCWLNAVADKGAYDLEYRIRRHDGAYRWFKTRGVVIRDEEGRILRWFGTCTDIEDQKRSEDALRESQERLRVALAASDTGTYRRDPATGEFLDVSDSLRGLFGLGAGQAGLALGDFLSRVHPEDRPRLQPAIDACRGGQDLEMEYRVLLPGGAVRWIYDRAKRVCDDRGEPAYLVGACTDITRRKRDEEALKEADRRKDEFLATLAHELRNPLAPLRNGLQVMRLADDRAARDRAREMMERQLAQMVRLVDDLLDISRVNRNRLDLRKARIELAAVVQNAVETVRPQIDERGHTLTVSLPEGPVYLDADLTRLSQVFWNLLNNSAKYTDPGGRISLSAERRPGGVVVTVCDTGVGIPREALPGLFQIFSQVDHSLERAQGGLGIGLALVKGLVEMHGGTVEAHSEGPGRGSTFVVSLPVAPGPAGGEPAAARPGHAKGGRNRILVVDDNRDAAASLGMMLSLLGNDTRTAHDGLQALELAEAFRPDVILLDIGLPKLNGYDACRRIRRESWGRGMLIVAATGWGGEDDRRRSREAGFDHHLVKPVDPVQLQELLRGAAVAGRNGNAAF